MQHTKLNANDVETILLSPEGEASTSTSTSSSNKITNLGTSLASSYEIDIIQTSSKDNTPTLTWTLHPFLSEKQTDLSTQKHEDEEKEIKPPKIHCQIMMMEVNDNNGNGENSQPVQTIQVTIENGNEKSAKVDNEKNDEFNALLSTLSRVMIQQYISIIQKQSSPSLFSTTYKLSIPSIDGHNTIETYNLSSTTESIYQLFQSILPTKYQNNPSIEMSDMVTSTGEIILGSIPRILIHQYNILHRGIGLIVLCENNEEPTLGISPEQNLRNKYDNNMNVYCHQRTSTKRIFPSLYDMFVGGVSTTGESSKLTAAREVGEELGLTRALRYIEQQQQQHKEYCDDNDEDRNNDTSCTMKNPLSDELFKCIVCTSYNRCVVTFFTYQYSNTSNDNESEKHHLDTIQWQEEEVAWGDFVPYDIVEKSAALSIQRLKKKGEWPGGIGYNESEMDVIDFDALNAAVAEVVEDSEATWNWKEWDYVPDGLLVWVAWLKWLQSQQKE